MLRRLAPLPIVALLAPGCGGGRTPSPAAPAAAVPATAAEPAARGDRPRYRDFELAGNQLVLPGPIVFAADALDAAASAAALWYIHDYLEAKPYVTLLRIEGHGNVSGEDALMLTGAEALAVGHWLVREGVDCKRLLAAAFGDTKPIASNSTVEGRAQNRRIDVVNAELRGRAIGDMPVDGSAPAAVPVCD
jgi:outer membrane protein OmpA-like peptidoglycan-associated protein